MSNLFLFLTCLLTVMLNLSIVSITSMLGYICQAIYFTYSLFTRLGISTGHGDSTEVKTSLSLKFYLLYTSY